MRAACLFRRVLLFILLLPLLGAGPVLRPFAGSEVLLIPPGADAGDEVVYRFPGVRRSGRVRLADVPDLASAVLWRGGPRVVAVVSLREGYARVVVDEGGEEGWLKLDPRWEVVPWSRFLVGRSIRLLPGLAEAATRIHEEPSEGGAVVGAASAGFSLTVGEVRDDWALVRSGETTLGWLRWRDGDGRLMVTVGPPGERGAP